MYEGRTWQLQLTCSRRRLWRTHRRRRQALLGPLCAVHPCLPSGLAGRASARPVALGTRYIHPSPSQLVPGWLSTCTQGEPRALPCCSVTLEVQPPS